MLASLKARMKSIFQLKEPDFKVLIDQKLHMQYLKRLSRYRLILIICQYWLLNEWCVEVHNPRTDLFYVPFYQALIDASLL